MDKTRKIIIDGYNLIYRIPELREYVHDNAILAREQLLLKLENFGSLQQKEKELMVVFDGHHFNDHPGAGHYTVNRIRVIYTASGETADEFIKKEMTRHAFPKNWLVVTSDDWDINSFLRAKGGRYISSEKFAEMMDNSSQSAIDETNKDGETISPSDWPGNSTAVFKVHKSWVAVNCSFQLTSVYMTSSGDFRIVPNSQPDGFHLDRNGKAITIINAGGHLEQQDILFEFKGNLIITRIEVLDKNGDHQEARLEVFT